MAALELPDRYGEILAVLKQRVHAAQLRARRAVNAELIELYWSIGRTILEQQQAAGWGSKVVERLSSDLRREFPEMTGLSRSNLMYMRAFAAAWPRVFVPQGVGQTQTEPVAQLPWSHIRLLLDKLDDQGAGTAARIGDR